VRDLELRDVHTQAQQFLKGLLLGDPLLDFNGDLGSQKSEILQPPADDGIGLAEVVLDQQFE